MIELSDVGVQFVTYDMTCRLANGTQVNPAALDVTICPFGQSPSRYAQWVPAEVTNMQCRVLLVGSKVTVQDPPACTLKVPVRGGDLWGRVIDGPEIDVAPIDRINAT